MKNKFHQFYLCSLFLFISNVIIAQCSEIVIQAEEDYISGRFNNAINNLLNCVDAKDDTKHLQVEALIILAKSYIALDSIDRAKKVVKKLIQINSNFIPSPTSTFYFRELVKSAKKEASDKLVSSVSKIGEKPEKAPVSVIVITEEDIKQRGYTDLEMLLHDLPGFDISQSNGQSYSSIYARGYRSDDSDRILLIIDGVEDNELWGNVMHLSRQYAISNIKSVEVIYGPASTTYGANASNGVISITTKNPADYIKNGKKFGLSFQAGTGQWNSSYIDATLAGRITPDNNSVTMSITGKYFTANEPDFSHYEWLDYRTPTYNNDLLNSYNNVLAINDDEDETKELFDTAAKYGINAFFEAIDTTGVILSELGGRNILARDSALFASVPYVDKTNTLLVSGKLKVYDFTFGFQHWQKKEGSGPSFSDSSNIATNSSWNPNSTMYYLKYRKNISSKLSFQVFSRYRQYGYSKENVLKYFRSYYDLGKEERLNLYNFFAEEEKQEPHIKSDYLNLRSNQFRNELTAIYQANSFNIVAGIENRYSVIQSDFSISESLNVSEASLSDVNRFFSQDLGLYIQSNYTYKEKLKITTGLRYDYNRIEQSDTFTLNPRLALVYYNQNWIFKSIYTRAHRPPTFYQYYSTIPTVRDYKNPNLANEIANNLEFSIQRRVAFFKIEIVGYFVNYKNAIELKDTTIDFIGGEIPTTQFVSTGKRSIQGGYIIARYRRGNFSAYANYTYTRPREDTTTNTQTSSYIRIGDIATHQVNIGGNYSYKNFNFNLRTNIIGKRLTGPSTTVVGNLQDFPAYAVFNGAITYKLSKFNIDFMINNIFDNEYFSPGIREADDRVYSSRLPQRGRNMHVRLRLDL